MAGVGSVGRGTTVIGVEERSVLSAGVEVERVIEILAPFDVDSAIAVVVVRGVAVGG